MTTLTTHSHHPHGNWQDERNTELRTPLDDYLDRQRDLTAVERFSAHHDRDAGPAHERWYRELLPATPPGPGQQYRFEVDMDRCTSCKSCVSACHSLNGLDEGESWRSVGVVIGAGPTGPTQQTVTTACHHCVDPACLKGCPVDAYEKDPITGIVAHLDDQCIGCSYCTWTCPYEVPRFNERLGIVRKCDLCRDRLAEGEAPACVQACPTGAIAVGVVAIEEVVGGTSADYRLVPGAPSSALTVPTTRYHRSDELPADAVPADEWTERPNHAHPPLVLMLVLTQLSVGTFGALAAASAFVDGLSATTARVGALVAAGAGLVAIGASVGHLGRPRLAWKAVLGVRHSWLSREILAFGVFAACAAVAAGSRLVAPASAVADVLGGVVTGVGVAAVACSALIYAATGRRFWRLDRTAREFAATAVATGAATATVVLVATAEPAAIVSPARTLALLAAAATTVALVADAVLVGPGARRDADLARSARLLAGPLGGANLAQAAWRAVGGILLPLLVAGLLTEPQPARPAVVAVAVAALVVLVRGELLRRSLFFRAMASPRMPGIPR